MSKKSKSAIGVNTRPKPIFVIILGIFLIIELIPIYLMLVNLFKDSIEIRNTPFALPTKLTLDNLVYVLTDKYKNIWVLYKNTIIVTGLGTVFTILFSSALAYFVTRSPGILANTTFTYFMIAMSVPCMFLYVPLAYLLRVAGIINAGLPVLILVYITFNISFGMFIYCGFIAKIPKEIEEAAILDGATHLQIYSKILMPLLMPATTTIAIFVGSALWNDFLTPLLLGGGIETITTGIYSAIGAYSVDWGKVFAYVFVASLPTVIFFLINQKRFIEGIVSGSVKG